MSAEETYEFERPAMACRFGIRIVGGDPEWNQRAASDALDEIHRVEGLLSMYDPASLLSTLNRAAADEPIGVDEELLEVLLIAGTIWEKTDGAFDPTMGPLVRLWRRWRREGTPPDARTIERVRDRVGMDKVEIDVDRQTVHFTRPGMEIDLGAIGKGYGVDCAVRALEDYEIPDFLVHSATSTIGVRGSMGGGYDGWRMGLEHPEDPDQVGEVVTLHDEACSCSNQDKQNYEYQNEMLGHVLDPRTGWPAPADSSILVVSTSATQADALSTAALVLGDDEAGRLAGGFPGLRVYPMPRRGETATIRFGIGEQTRTENHRERSSHDELRENRA